MVGTREGSLRRAMAEVEIAQDALIVHVKGMDRLFALRSRLEVPLSHVEGAEVDPEEARRRWHGIMERGIWVPGPSRRAPSTGRASWYSGTCTTSEDGGDPP
jgi:hypothetical protein